MTKIFYVVYSIHGHEEEVRFDYIPEKISSDEIKLNNYLKIKISKQEHVEEDEISINGVTCTLKSD
ncbi:hypothetical protein [Paenibacillus silvae]|uniref:Uncharacterized protein n=1 Tax=Paenibacillus silvae TaxID=1325358 RepID=A0A2W6NQ42_9BACL|nr:hypothetical protein [Paenibacillus silvae]PZT57378.1 hypothetical protein DN757_01600 [Paenibacillus silvae]